MIIQLNLQNKYKAAQWEKHDNLQIKGYYDAELIWAIKDSNGDSNYISEILKNANGCFSLVLDLPEAIIVAVDRIRSFPMFYGLNDTLIAISDNAEDLLKYFDHQILEEKREEFIFTGFTTGSSTLFSRIKQLQAGELIILDKKNSNKIEVKRYYEFRHRDTFYNVDIPELLNELDHTYNVIFKNIIKSLEGKCAVIPLSGGYDSRLIAFKLKELGYRNVICFTYGDKSNKEVQISRKIAESLGFSWQFVPYNYQDWKGNIHSDIFTEYELFAGNLSSLPHIQDWLAVKKLKENNSIPTDSIFIPGHANDFIAGSHIPSKYLDKEFISKEELISDIVKKHYVLQTKKSVTFSEYFNLSIANAFQYRKDIYSPSEAADEFEKWDWEERQAKFITNSIRVYEFFGFDWRLPFWEKDIISFWEKIPLEQRVQQKLFHQYCYEYISLKDIAYYNSTSKEKSYLKKFKKYTRNLPFINLVGSVRRYRRSNNVLYGTISPIEYFLGSLTGKTHINSFFTTRYLKKYMK